MPYAGLAALLELLSEPLYILAQARMQISLRVSVEAFATVAKILATLAFLLLTNLPEAISVSIAQVQNFSSWKDDERLRWRVIWLNRMAVISWRNAGCMCSSVLDSSCNPFDLQPFRGAVLITL